ncbi:hypothetical protein BGZ58_003025, partial [Dissophora ornata]
MKITASVLALLVLATTAFAAVPPPAPVPLPAPAPGKGNCKAKCLREYNPATHCRGGHGGGKPDKCHTEWE